MFVYRSLGHYLIPSCLQMLILAAVFRCLDPMLTIAACLSSKPLFVSPVDKREEANKSVGYLLDPVIPC